MDDSFEINEIEGVSILIHAKGKRYAVVAKKSEDREECKQIRIALALSLLQTHAVVSPSPDDLNKSNLESALENAKTKH